MSDYPKYRKKGDIHWRWYFGNNISYRHLVDDSVGLLPNKGNGQSVLDIGCGDGVSSYILASRGYSVTGIDPEAKGIEIANEKAKYLDFEGIVTTVEDYERDTDKDFDYLYSLNTIEHTEDPTVYLKLMNRVKNFGVIVTDNADHVKGKHPYHIMEFTPATIKELFRDFRVEQFYFDDEWANKYFIGVKISHV